MRERDRETDRARNRKTTISLAAGWENTARTEGVVLHMASVWLGFRQLEKFGN